MSDPVIKNILDLDTIETATGEEQLLVVATDDSVQSLKLLPSSNFAGSGGSGSGSSGSGAGFDLIGKKATIVTPLGGREIVEVRDTAFDPSGGDDLTFDFFYDDITN